MFRARRAQMRTLVPIVVLTACLAVLAVFAVHHRAQPSRLLDHNDAGIWVTNNGAALFGRLNKSAGSLDAYFNPPGGAQASYSLDVLQDRGAVVARDETTGALMPVDVAAGGLNVSEGGGLPEGSVNVGATAQLSMGGGTIAALDPTSGKVWATRYAADGTGLALDGLDPSLPPLAELGPQAAPTPSTAPTALAVDPSGVVFAASTSGRLARITPDGAGFENPRYDQLPGPFTSVQVAARSGEAVVLDPAAGRLVLPGNRVVDIGAKDPLARLQQSGPDDPTVMVATTRALIGVPVDAPADVRPIFEDGTGGPATPVVLGGCTFAAWAGKPGAVVRSCGTEVKRLTVDRSGGLVRPVFRLNRGQVVLNDVSDGRVFDLESQRSLDNWEAIQPPESREQTTKDPQEQTTKPTKKQKPEANPDQLGARLGRTTVLHVLDNDTDPGGRILSIDSVTQPEGRSDNPARISPDRQTVLLSLGEDDSDQSFRYTIGNGTGGSATATVRVVARAAEENSPPNRRTVAREPTWMVVAGEERSVPVLDDWRDYDGDPVLLEKAETTRGTVTPGSEGRLDFTAPARSGEATLEYQVSDGVAAASDQVSVTVMSATAAQGTPAVTQPDVVRAEAGKAVVIEPLANDLPGADPTDPDARLTLAGEVPQVADAKIRSDLRAGTITFSAAKVGAYSLTYAAGYGNSAVSKGSIRVDVVNPPDGTESPLAMPDSTAVRGQLPVTVDVLANDLDPGGHVLTVQSATPDDPLQVQVAVLRGRWLRITPLKPELDPAPQVVHYSVTNGLSAAATGDVTVSQLPSVQPDPPITRNDTATVRAGDQVVIPVLDNDRTANGAALSLLADVETAPVAGQLSVSDPAGGAARPADVGQAYAAGSVVRFVAPPTVPEAREVDISYVAQTEAGDVSSGTATVTIQPEPTPERPDQPPVPGPIDARAVAGQTILIPVPSSGQDPDGDSISVLGIGGPARLGRVLGVTPTGLRYQAYPDSAGTDALSYVVTDRYGRTGSATLRVAVVPPGEPQPPAAVPDAVTADPGARVRVNVLVNDLFAKDDAVTVLPLEQTNDGLAGQAALESPTGPLTAQAPDGDDPVVVAYGLTGAGGPGDSAAVTIRSQDGFNNPPQVFDQVAKPENGSATVDPLAHAWDVDGESRDLRVSAVSSPAATISGGKVVVRQAEQSQTIAYEVTDGDGATATATIFVPPAASGPPHAKVGATIEVDEDASTTVALADYVVSARAQPVSLTTSDRLWASPAAHLKITAPTPGTLEVTAKDGYVGPGSITLEVTDGTSLTDPDGRTAVVSVPVQIGPLTPVLRCPNTVTELVEGGRSRELSIAALCHVWTADPDTVGSLTYSGSWAEPLDGVVLSGADSSVLTVEAQAGAEPGGRAELEVGVSGTDAEPATLRFTVVPAPPPTLRPITLEGVRQGTTREIAIKSQMTSKLRDPAFTVISARQLTGEPAEISGSGGVLRVNPGARSSGAMSFEVVASDLADPARRDRQVTGTVSLVVYGAPDPPSSPVGGRALESNTATLSWRAGSANGAPIRYFEVSGGGVTQRCPSSPCKIRQLPNGQPLTFTVRANNRAGWSEPSASSEPITPDAVPKAVTGLSASAPADGSVQLSWAAAEVDGTPVNGYRIVWAGRSMRVGGDTLTARVRGLDNKQRYTFSIAAVNEAGVGRAVTTKGQSSGRPSRPKVPDVDSSAVAGGAAAAVTLTWPDVDPNGPGPVSYSVTRDGQRVCTDVTGNRCVDDEVRYNGDRHQYVITATNATGGADHTTRGRTATFTAVGEPSAWDDWSATPVGEDGEVRLDFTVPASRGKESKVSYVVGEQSHSLSHSTAGRASETIKLGYDSEKTLALKVCNESTCRASEPRTVRPYGPLSEPVFVLDRDGPSTSFLITANGNGKSGTLTVTSSHGGNWTDSGSDTVRLQGSRDVGYSTTVTYTATFTDPGRSPRSHSEAITTADPNVSLSVSKGNPGTTSYCWTAPCSQIRASGTGLAPNTNYRLYFSTDCAGRHRAQCLGSAGGAERYTFQTITTRGDGSFDNSDRYFGYPGAHVWIEIDAFGRTFKSAPSESW